MKFFDKIDKRHNRDNNILMRYNITNSRIKYF